MADKLAPTPDGPIVLLPIRTGGSVSAILYLDSEGRDVAPEIDGLKLLTEFSSAQLDRLMFIGEAAGEEGEAEEAEVVEEVAASEDTLVEVVPAEEVEEVSAAQERAGEKLKKRPQRRLKLLAPPKPVPPISPNLTKRNRRFTGMPRDLPSC